MVFSTSLLALLLAIVSLTAAIPTAGPGLPFGRYDYGVDVNMLVRRQDSSGPLALTGAPATGNNGSMPVRREVRDLQSDSVMWTLYILGLDMMQAINQSDETSWYQIMGMFFQLFSTTHNVPLGFASENLKLWVET